ncbi:MAG: dephospho-CoA kinase [Candidatus Diapherotrites archaeon]|nr:dephospho-CoA kinase [Candidatus Diapherotrites archaeon]
MIVIGITGQIASGKTSFAKELGKYLTNNETIDCDKLVESIYKKEKIRKKVVNVFKNVLNKDGSINKKKLAKLVFKNYENVNKINKIIHPEVKKEIKKIMKQNKKFFIIDAPLLFESGLDKICDIVIFVYCPIEIRINRVRKMSKKELMKRESYLIEENKKMRNCDLVVNNIKRNEMKKHSFFICKSIINLFD